MASIASIDVYEAVLRGKEKSYYEALKEFLEIFVDLILNRKRKVFDWAVANMHIKYVEYLKKC